MWSSNNDKDTDSQSKNPIESSEVRDLFGNPNIRTTINDALQSVSDLVNTPRTNQWNLGDMFRFSLPTDPFFGTSAPNVHEYSRCIDNGGRSIWAEDGVWRCLLKGQSLPPNLKQEFRDYTGFLEYQRKLLKQAEVDRQLTGRQNQSDDQHKSPFSWNALSQNLPSFPGSDRPKLISEEEAKGKRIVSQNKTSESFTLDDGTLQTRTKEIRYYEDGTATLKTTDDKQDPSKNWFWK